jgi:hypothetical protein
METITIDAAVGGVYETIGQMLQNVGKEDASGARRHYVALLINKDYEPLCRDLNVSLASAEVLRQTFFKD